MIDQGHLEEANDRTVSPFAAVIAAYHKHAARVAAKTTPELLTRRFRKNDIVIEPVRPRAAFYYKQTALLLETL